MTDFLLQMGLSNACFSLALASAAMIFATRVQRPQLVYLLWLLVFIKLLTPPMVALPIAIPKMVASSHDFTATARLPVRSAFHAERPVATAGTVHAHAWWPFIGTGLQAAKPWLASVWLLGSVVIFVWSVGRVIRFNRMVLENTEPAPQQVQRVARTLAESLGVKTLPIILTTSAHLSPMVWWTGGRIRIVIPNVLIDQMDASEWRLILAHELAHVRRRDYLVRWLEWLASVCFWWNPVVWWAQRNLRATEEICRDALVMSCLQPKPHTYANSLLTAVEFLACPALRPPAMASEINSGGFLERRFRMIVSGTENRANSRWGQAFVLLCAVVVLPLGMVYGADKDAVGKRLKAAVAAGELTGKQARIMLRTLSNKDSDGKETKPDQAHARLIKVRKQLADFVEAGKISKEDAVKRYQETEKAIKERMAAGRKQRGSKRMTPENLEQAGLKIRQAIAEGKLTKEEGRAKMAVLRKMVGQQNEGAARKPDWKAIKTRIEGAVESGKMTRGQADKAYQGIKERMGKQGDGARHGGAHPNWEGMQKRIEAAVERGDLTREEANAKQEAIRKKIAERHQQ